MKVTERFTPDSVWQRTALYGHPKSGKTRAATSLPWGARWGERAIYVAADPGSSELGSVLLSNRERLIIAEPETKVQAGRMIYDPLSEAVAIATRDWKKEFPDAKTLIWDTMTQTSRDLLSAYADSGAFSEKHVTFGKPGSLEYHAAPMEGDYAAAQRSIQFILDYLFRQPLHLIILFHEDHVEPKENNPSETLYGGPTIVGKAGIKAIAARFDNLFRCECKDVMVKNARPNEPNRMTKHLIHTRQKYIWLAGFRNPLHDNPMPVIELDSDPVNFWRAFDAATQVKTT